jgi:hypothetical protein
MPKKDYLVWLIVIAAVGLIGFFPFLPVIIDAPVEPWLLIFLLNIFLPAVLWILVKGIKPGIANAKKHPQVKMDDQLKFPGLELKAPIWLFSLMVGIIISLPGIIDFGSYSMTPVILSMDFFVSLIRGMFLIGGVFAFLITYTYLKSKSATKDNYISFQRHSPLLGAIFGIIGAVHILAMIILNYLPVSMGFYSQYRGSFTLSLFHSFFVYTSLNKITPLALELIFGLFLFELVTILSVYMSRKTYGHNRAVEYRIISKNLAVAFIFYAVLLILIPSLFLPISGVLSGLFGL